ncbi:hypothetical protein [Paradevosia shaoguanensis]|uniref:hypothetical protein n=1 Tax=Paradevosia shaoguanensis TaxID=1335043 RepID=UPI00363B1CB1
MPTIKHHRNRLLPLYIGFVMILGAVGYVAWHMYTIDCGITPVAVFLVLGVVPIIYLALMYLAFVSQE